jgi:hypothetical protein
MTPPDFAASPLGDGPARIAARSLAGAIVGGLLIAAIEFALTRESVSLAATEQLIWLARLAVLYTLAAIPLGISIGVLEHRARGRPPLIGGYVIAILTGAGVGALVSALQNRLVDSSFSQDVVGFDMELLDHFLYILWQLIFWGSVGAVLHASSLRQQRVAMLLRARELERLRSERGLSEIRLAALQAQIEPEFVLTSLSEVERLYEEDPGTADRVLDALIRFLREATPLLRRQISTLGAEARLLQAYVLALSAATGDREALLYVDIDQRALAMPVPSGVLLSLAQALLAEPATNSNGRLLDVRAKALGTGSGVDFTFTAATENAPSADLQALVARVARRLAITCGRSPVIELRHDGSRRLTLCTVLINQGEMGHEQVPEN